MSVNTTEKYKVTVPVGATLIDALSGQRFENDAEFEVEAAKRPNFATMLFNHPTLNKPVEIDPINVKMRPVVERYYRERDRGGRFILVDPKSARNNGSKYTFFAVVHDHDEERVLATGSRYRVTAAHNGYLTINCEPVAADDVPADQREAMEKKLDDADKWLD